MYLHLRWLFSSQDFEKTDDVRLLLEMFPTISLVEATHCLSLSNSSVEEAVQLVLHRQEIGESLSHPEVLHCIKSFNSSTRNNILGLDLFSAQDQTSKWRYAQKENNRKVFLHWSRWRSTWAQTASSQNCNEIIQNWPFFERVLIMPLFNSNPKRWCDIWTTR